MLLSRVKSTRAPTEFVKCFFHSLLVPLLPSLSLSLPERAREAEERADADEAARLAAATRKRKSLDTDRRSSASSSSSSSSSVAASTTVYSCRPFDVFLAAAKDGECTLPELAHIVLHQYRTDAELATYMRTALRDLRVPVRATEREPGV